MRVWVCVLWHCVYSGSEIIWERRRRKKFERSECKEIDNLERRKRQRGGERKREREERERDWDWWREREGGDAHRERETWSDGKKETKRERREMQHYVLSSAMLTRKNLSNNPKNITDFEDRRFLALDRKKWKKLCFISLFCILIAIRRLIRCSFKGDILYFEYFLLVLCSKKWCHIYTVAFFNTYINVD